MEARNLTAFEFCKYLGVAKDTTIMKCLRELGLVSFFNIGKKFMYPLEEAEKVNQRLRNNEISIKTNKGYYIIITD